MWKMKLSIISIALLFVATKGQRIAGGSAVEISEYPYAAALLTDGGTGNFQQQCGGTIITATAILSAASCFYTGEVANPASWWRARVGSSLSNSGGSVHIINRITVHPSFVVTTRVNDIAVLRPTVAIDLRPGIAEVAHIAGAVYTLTNNEQIWAIGWGAASALDTTFSPELRHVQFFVIDQTTCANRYRALNFEVTSNMVCVGWLDVGIRGQCAGDAGSPLIHNGVVVGVYSWTEGCGQGWWPNINTRVSPYAQWIVAAALA